MNAIWKELGLGNALLYAADRVLSKAGVRVRRYLFVVQPLPNGAPARGTRTVRELQPDDIGRLPFPVGPDVIRRRLAQGSLCLVLEIGGVFAGYGWFHCGPYDEDEVRCRFIPDRMVWDYDIYIVPRYRGTRAFATLWNVAGARMRALGYTHTASRISAYNSASIRSHASLGGRVVGSAVFVSCAGLELLLSRARIALTRAARPEIRLTAP